MAQLLLNAAAANAIAGASTNYSVSMLSDIDRIYIYSGVMPSVADYAANYATYDAQNLLVSFASSGAYTSLSAQDYKIRWVGGVFSAPVAAGSTGIATWFAISSSSTNRTDVSNTTWFVLGTVGNSVSDADLKVSSVNIVAGDFYTCSGFSFSYPLIHEV